MAAYIPQPRLGHEGTTLLEPASSMNRDNVFFFKPAEGRAGERVSKRAARRRKSSACAEQVMQWVR